MTDEALVLIELQGVSKQFGQNVVLRSVDFQLRAGEVHALVGENGAGKSTCLGMMYGLLQPNEGLVKVSGNTAKIVNPAHAQELGVSCVFQELSLAGAMSVAENIFVGRMPSRYGLVDYPRLYQQAEDLLKEFGLQIDVTQPVDTLPVSLRQIVEIVKAISLDAKVLLLDEPTSALTPNEVQALFAMLRKLTAKGIGIVYVCHHMSEIFAIADRITVLRDGQQVNSCYINDTTPKQVISQMVGGNIPELSKKSQNLLGSIVLEAKDLALKGCFEDINFVLHKGEIVSLAGLLGSGRSQIAQALCGLETGWTGELIVTGKEVKYRSFLQAIDDGLGYVPEERKSEGLFLDFSVRDNVVAASLSQCSQIGFLKPHLMASKADQAIADFDVKTPNQDIPIGSLSGGNQQKVMLAKWLQKSPQILIIEEPTKGVDVGAKFQIHAELRNQAAKGMTILLVSSDFAELASFSDRILVVREGQIAGEILAGDATEDSILDLASTGVPRAANAT